MSENVEMIALKKTIESELNNGHEFIPTSLLIELIDSINSDHELTEYSQKIIQQDFENAFRRAELYQKGLESSFNATIEAGLNATKSAIIINGGAAIAILAFLGNMIAQPISYKEGILTGFGEALLCFVIGVGCAGVSNGLRYLTQFCYNRKLEHEILEKEEKIWSRTGNGLNILTIFICTASFCLFFYGGYLSYETFMQKI